MTSLMRPETVLKMVLGYVSLEKPVDILQYNKHCCRLASALFLNAHGFRFWFIVVFYIEILGSPLKKGDNQSGELPPMNVSVFGGNSPLFYLFFYAERTYP